MHSQCGLRPRENLAKVGFRVRSCPWAPSFQHASATNRTAALIQHVLVHVLAFAMICRAQRTHLCMHLQKLFLQLTVLLTANCTSATDISKSSTACHGWTLAATRRTHSAVQRAHFTPRSAATAAARTSWCKGIPRRSAARRRRKPDSSSHDIAPRVR
jgi:hypothetical protein